MEHHRHTVKINLKAADYPILSRTLNDPSIRVMVFCAAEDKGLQDVAFPHQSELKVNGGEIKANLRGLKNKPGSTRPVDITKELRLKISNYVNTVEMTYALTQKAGEVSQVSYLDPKTPSFAFPSAFPFCAAVYCYCTDLFIAEILRCPVCC